MKKQGFWTEEFTMAFVSQKWPNRFRDAWERCLQFNKQKNFKMNQESVMLPTGDWAKNRLKNLGKNDIIRFNSNSQSGFGKNVLNWVGRDKAYPTNVLHLATETGNKNHSAVFLKVFPNGLLSFLQIKKIGC